MTDQPDRIPDPIPSELAQEDASFTDLVQEFVDGLSERVAKIDAAIETGDFAQLKMLAHQLKGSAGGYGYPVLTRKAAEMELHAVAAELDGVRKSLDELQGLVARVVVRL